MAPLLGTDLLAALVYTFHAPADLSPAIVLAGLALSLGNIAIAAFPLRSHTRALTGGFAARLFDEPYLSLDGAHDGLLLHVVYHRPKCWDYIPPGSRIPQGESAQWGDYHLRELALCILRMGRGSELPRFDEGFPLIAEGPSWK